MDPGSWMDGWMDGWMEAGKGPAGPLHLDFHLAWAWASSSDGSCPFKVAREATATPLHPRRAEPEWPVQCQLDWTGQHWAAPASHCKPASSRPWKAGRTGHHWLQRRPRAPTQCHSHCIPSNGLANPTTAPQSRLPNASIRPESPCCRSSPRTPHTLQTLQTLQSRDTSGVKSCCIHSRKLHPNFSSLRDPPAAGRHKTVGVETRPNSHSLEPPAQLCPEVVLSPSNAALACPPRVFQGELFG